MNLIHNYVINVKKIIFLINLMKINVQTRFINLVNLKINNYLVALNHTIIIIKIIFAKFVEMNV